MADREYLLPDERGSVVILDSTLTHMYRHIQKGALDKEAGGQLFSPNPHEVRVIVSTATGPYPQDRRTRSYFEPNRRIAIQDRKLQFEKGNNAIGIWHTHPQAIPSPSGQDISTTLNYLSSSQAALDGFILAILGNKGEPISLSLWLALSTQRNISWVKLLELPD